MQEEICIELTQKEFFESFQISDQMIKEIKNVNDCRMYNF